MPRQRLLFDLDGTVAKFRQVDKLEVLYEEGYFLNLETIESVVEAINILHNSNPDIEIFVMSAVLTDSRFALSEKNTWIDKYFPWIDSEHRIFPPCGENKLNYVPGGIRESDCLLDDYTHNLSNWEPPARGIKLLNGINHTKETWNGAMIRYDKSPEEICNDIVEIALNNKIIKDGRPIHQKVEKVNETYDLDVRSRYISSFEKKELMSLSEEQAMFAFNKGIHLVMVNEYAEFHGMSLEYLVTEITSKNELRNIYHSTGDGILHRVCISPYYSDVSAVKDIIVSEAPYQGNKRLESTKELYRIPKL